MIQIIICRVRFHLILVSKKVVIPYEGGEFKIRIKDVSKRYHLKNIMLNITCHQAFIKLTTDFVFCINLQADSY